MFAAVAALIMQSCLHDNNDNFDLSAAERIDAVVAETGQILEDSEYGWILHYYAGAEYAYGGLDFGMIFKNGKVTMSQMGYTDATDNYITKTSTYKLTRDQGPVLAFDTYNDLLHSWGDPMGEDAPTDVDGWQADYEFVIMNISEDKSTITLKGKKWGNYMTLERLTKPVSEYLDAASLIAAYIEGYFSTLVLKEDGKKARFITDGSTYTIQYQTEDGGVDYMEVPYTYTDKGVLFAEPIELYGITISGFYMEMTENEDESVEVSFPLMDDSSRQLVEPNDPNEIVAKYNWYVAASNLGTVAKAGFDAFVEGCAGEGETLQYMYLGTLIYRGNNYYGISFNSGGYVGCATVDIESDFLDPNLLTISFNSNAANAGYYTNNCNFGKATAPFYSTFRIELDDVTDPKTMKMTDVNNPENTMTLVTDVINNPADN